LHAYSLDSSERELLRRLLRHLRICLAMDNSPALSFTPEYHRYPIIARRLFRLTWDAEAEMLDLHDIAEIAIRVCHNSLAGVCALRKLRANPIEPSADRFPSFFDCAAESARNRTSQIC
jgi:hypothetical protein